MLHVIQGNTDSGRNDCTLNISFFILQPFSFDIFVNTRQKKMYIPNVLNISKIFSFK